MATEELLTTPPMHDHPRAQRDIATRPQHPWSLPRKVLVAVFAVFALYALFFIICLAFYDDIMPQGLEVPLEYANPPKRALLQSCLTRLGFLQPLLPGERDDFMTADAYHSYLRLRGIFNGYTREEQWQYFVHECGTP
jgi:hypothetical protein